MNKKPQTRIERIILHNFKRFKTLDIKPNEDLNLLVGVNESGKTSLLNAINFVINASYYQIESMGLDTIINQQAVAGFSREYEDGKATVNDLPETFVELYLNEQGNSHLNGKNNSINKDHDGLMLKIERNQDLDQEIKDSLDKDNFDFPYDYYKISFKTFAGQTYSKRMKYLSGILVDQSNSHEAIAVSKFVRDFYYSFVDDKVRAINKAKYRQIRNKFANEQLSSIVNGERDSLAIQTNSKDNLETSLTIKDKSNITLDNKGKGEQTMIKTRVALNRKDDLRVVMLEEPENHLGHTKMKQLIECINQYANGAQLFLSTHSSLIASGLDLRNCFILNLDTSVNLTKLSDLEEDTGKFFIKAPNTNILEMVLSPKVILVEGASEYIMMGKFFEMVSETSETSLKENEVHIISVGGISFKRYLEIAKITGIKTAVITDNDSDVDRNCKEKYKEYESQENIKIFYPQDNQTPTFEIAIYSDNKKSCDDILGQAGRDVQNYMLNNKTESAYDLATSSKDIKVPKYIEQAINWIVENG